ncbi:calponin homology domain-containing protein [Neocallimastix sp. 'constans']|jgi:Ca2+-binding EF-hand superfamily protein
MATEYQSKASVEVVDDQARLLDKGWERTQIKTFTNWINNKLAMKGCKSITNLDTDLSTGERLIELLEIIGGESLGRYNKNPKLRLQRIENVNKALEFIKSRGVSLTNIGAEDIVDSNPKLILGLIWTIILRFTIAEISEEGLNAKEGLLLWCQRQTADYKPEVNVKDFTFSWKDGLALCALIHHNRPDLLDYNSLDKSDAKGNLTKAFEVAEKELNIPKLLDVEDFIDVPKPDERSVMTYIAQYFHAFSAQNKVSNSSRRVGKFADVLATCWDMENDYERRATELIQNIEALKKEWETAPLGDNYNDAKAQFTAFEDYKHTSKRKWMSEKREIENLLGNIQIKLKTYNLIPYNPPEGLYPADIDDQWNSLITTEAERKRNLSNNLAEIKDQLRKSYANSANELQDSINNISIQLSGLGENEDSSLEDQLNEAKKYQTEANSLEPRFKEIEDLNAKCEEAHIEDNQYCIYTPDDIKFDYELVLNTIQKKIAFIENQIVARSVSNLTPQQLEEYTNAFRHFDKDDNNLLNRDELKAVLQSIGVLLSDDEFNKTYDQLVDNPNNLSTEDPSVGVPFEKYLNYVKSIAEDKTSPDQLREAFKVLAKDKDYVTEADMAAGGFPPATIEYLKQVIPPKDGVPDSYDYSAFLDIVFG